MSETSLNSTVAVASPLADEATRLCQVFEVIARDKLAEMATAARAVLRAWAEAEMAVETARQSSEPAALGLLSAEEFRVRAYLPREEVSRERVVRWCKPGRADPLDDEQEARVAYHDGRWSLMRRGSVPRPEAWLGERGVFDRVTYLEEQTRLDTPRLAESLSVPSVIAGGNVGWEPLAHSSPALVLAELDKIEAGYVPYEADRARTVENVHIGYGTWPPRPVAGSN